jgi:hypothetical protein
MNGDIKYNNISNASTPSSSNSSLISITNTNHYSRQSPLNSNANIALALSNNTTQQNNQNIILWTRSTPSLRTSDSPMNSQLVLNSRDKNPTVIRSLVNLNQNQIQNTFIQLSRDQQVFDRVQRQ